MTTARNLTISSVAGLGAGLAAWLLFEVLPDPWGTLANTSALWGLVPFFVAFGVRARGWRAAGYGILSLALMVTAWALLFSGAVTGRELVMWAAAATIGGFVCGVAGGLARSRRTWVRRTWVHCAALALIGGVIAGEAVYGILLIGGPQWWFELVVGLALPVVLGRRWRDRVFSVLGASVIACALYGAYLLYDAIALL